MGLKLTEFLVAANAAGYASGEGSKWVNEADGSKTIHFERDQFRMHDNFFGGEPYGGREMVFKEGKPYWIMVYYGYVEEGVNDKVVYAFLQESLREMPEDAPFRGPKVHTNRSLRYENTWEGNVEQFRGEETIYKDGERVFWTGYIGGLVDQRK